MNERRIHANDLTIGDVITGTDQPVTVQAIETGEGGLVVVNPGQQDEMRGRAWQNVIVQRDN
ncbi:hypothetical protein ACH4GZ_38885 [Streptomyces hygroscopicus]|uniref:hypothetical protein n=1 Tax=Streptomyces hygroscopicus TaxID=1912 RepID=UPI0037BCF760